MTPVVEQFAFVVMKPLRSGGEWSARVVVG